MSTEIDTNPLVIHAERELRAAGLFDEDADYDGMLGQAVLDLVRVFAGQGHSGASAAMTIDLFARLTSYEALTPLTDDPAEWNHIAEEMAGQPDLWQSSRNSAAFSNDGGKTYKMIGEDTVHVSLSH